MNMANDHIFLLMLIDCAKNPDKRHIWTIESVEAASKPCFALKSASGRYLRNYKLDVVIPAHTWRFN